MIKTIKITHNIFWLLCIAYLLPANTTAAVQPFGTNLGTWMGVPCYSNGTVGFQSGTDYANYFDGKYMGQKWQCVEFVRRFWYITYNNYVGRSTAFGNGDAENWFTGAQNDGLTTIQNNGTSRPKPGDILCFTGHVAIVRSITSSAVFVIHQNYTRDYPDTNYSISISSSGIISNLGSSLTCQGWIVSPTSSIELVSPINNFNHTKGSNLTFDWTDYPSAANYEIWIDNLSGFGSPEVGFNNGASTNWVSDGIVSASNFALSTVMQSNLPQNLYYWKVRALNASKQPLSDWSTVRQLTLLDQPQPISNLSPSNHSTHSKGTPITFSWSASSGASYYEIWIDNLSGFGSPEIGFNNGASANWLSDGIVSTNTFSLSVALQANLPQNVYYWKVRALNSSKEPITGWTWSPTWDLTFMTTHTTPIQNTSKVDILTLHIRRQNGMRGAMINFPSIVDNSYRLQLFDLTGKKIFERTCDIKTRELQIGLSTAQFVTYIISQSKSRKTYSGTVQIY